LIEYSRQSDVGVFIVIVFGFVATARIFDGAQGSAIVGVMNGHMAVNVFEFDMRAAAAQFPAQVMTGAVVVIAHMQSEIIFDSAIHGAGLNLRSGVGGDRQIDRSIHRIQLDP
jgi:hypothetical protein